MITGNQFMQKHFGDRNPTNAYAYKAINFGEGRNFNDKVYL